MHSDTAYTIVAVCAALVILAIALMLFSVTQTTPADLLRRIFRKGC